MLHHVKGLWSLEQTRLTSTTLVVSRLFPSSSSLVGKSRKCDVLRCRPLSTALGITTIQLFYSNNYCQTVLLYFKR